MKRSVTSITAVGLLLVAGLVALQLGHPVLVKAQRGCSVQLVRGVYGVHLQGWFYTNWPEKIRVPAAQIGTGFFDGAGNMSAHMTTSVDGEPSRETFGFTYQVNPDCTGSVTPTPGSNAGPADFVVVDSGKQLLILGTSLGMVWSGRAIRQ